MVGIVDYGVGNLFSLRSALQSLGKEAFVSGDPERLAQADRLVLPGVGAFPDAAQKLHGSGLDAFLKAQAQAGKPLLGICLGMQLLFERSSEYGSHPGLGLLKGEVLPIKTERKLPHMGWNRLEVKRGRLLEGMDGQFVYFVHSYCAAHCQESLAAVTEYGASVPAAVELGSIFGCQFHPEKSGEAGLNILRRFCEI